MKLLLTLIGVDVLESPSEMLGKDGDVYKVSMDTEPSGRNNLGWEGHLYIKQAEQSTRDRFKWIDRLKDCIEVSLKWKQDKWHE